MMRTGWIRTALVVALAAVPARAGVVITQDVTSSDGSGGTKKSTTTLTIEGNRSKAVTENSTVILDLEQGKMLILDTAKKTATEMPTAFMKAMTTSVGSALEYRPTGVKKTIAGHSCEEYVNHVTLRGEVTTVICVSKDAPGAADMTALNREMLKRMSEGTTGAQPKLPEGVTLSEERTFKSVVPKLQGMPPEIAKKIEDEQKKRGPQVTKTVATSLESQSIGPEAFAVPKGYTTKTLPVGNAKQP